MTSVALTAAGAVLVLIAAFLLSLQAGLAVLGLILLLVGLFVDVEGVS